MTAEATTSTARGCASIADGAVLCGCGCSDTLDLLVRGLATRGLSGPGLSRQLVGCLTLAETLVGCLSQGCLTLAWQIEGCLTLAATDRS